MDISNWNYYYNTNNGQKVRANLVYTPYINAEKNILCMSFNRDVNYHNVVSENLEWSVLDLKERFDKELNFYLEAKRNGLPVLKVIDVEFHERKIFLEWPGEDFYMAGLASSYDQILPDWKEQWVNIIDKLKESNISKFSLHPNSFVIRDSELVPFNWFFCYYRNDPGVRILDVMKQISADRQDKLEPVLESMGISINQQYQARELENVCFYSFKSNYPDDLIRRVVNA